MKRKTAAFIMAIMLIFVSFGACAGVENPPPDVNDPPPDSSAAVEGTAAKSDAGSEGAGSGQSGDKIINGDFAAGTSDWGLYLEGGKAALEAAGNGHCRIGIERVGSVFWGVQLYQDGIALTQGSVYRLSFDAASTVPRSGTIRIQKNASPYTAYMEEQVSLTAEINRFSFDFEMQEDLDPASRLVFNLGVQESTGEKPDPEEHDVTVGNFELILLEGMESSFEYDGHKNIPVIHVGQLGYRPDDVKKAVLVTDDSAFEIRDAATGETVFSGTASEQAHSAAADETVRVADFSELTAAGRYIIRNSEGESYPFDIHANPYTDVTRAVLDMLNYQMCGVAVDAGIWSYGACHLSDAVIYGTDKTKDVSGGWHDAGDYGRYVSPAAKAVTDFLLAHQLAPNPAPDLLDIVRYKLDWMLKMQDSETGGVYHKVSAANFCDVIMPDEETAALYLSPISPTATGGFAASLAFASRVYRGSNPEYAGKLLSAAEKAWEWLIQNPMYKAFRNPDDITTGEYYDISSRDERLWAACELYSATGKDIYHDYILNELLLNPGLGWAGTGHYASIAYVLMPTDATDSAQRERMAESLLNACEDIMNLYSEDPYMISLGVEYPWGSNMHVANNAVLLLIGDMLRPNPVYAEAAMEHVHYLLGRNALSQSYITGFGSRPPERPYHRPSKVAGSAAPGMVAGGPNGQLEDPFVATMLKGLPPAKCYADSENSYSTNEVTIYWNSPVYLLLTLLGLG